MSSERCLWPWRVVLACCQDSDYHASPGCDFERNSFDVMRSLVQYRVDNIFAPAKRFGDQTWSVTDDVLGVPGGADVLLRQKWTTC